MTEPLTHVLRDRLPWRPDEDRRTECGRAASEMASVVERDEAVRRWKQMGAQRASLWLCMTCVQTVNRWKVWADDPIEGLMRRLSYHRYGESGERDLLTNELRALVLLVEAHPEEWRAAVDGQASIPDLRSVRASKARRA